MKTKNENLKKYEYQANKYIFGFFVAVLLTGLMFYSVHFKMFTGNTLIFVLLLLAFVQIIVQLNIFLHVGGKNSSKTVTWSVVYTFLMSLVLVVASIWIMINMNYNMHMSPEQMNEFMLEQNKKGF